MLKFRGISGKLFMLVLMPTFGLTLVGGLSYFSLESVRSRFHIITRLNIPQKNYSAEIRANIPEVIAYMQAAALNPKDSTVLVKSIEQARAHMEKVRSNQVELLNLKNPDELKSVIEKFNSTLDEFEGQASSILDQLEAGTDEALKGAQAALKSEDIRSARYAVYSSVTDLDAIVAKNLNSDSDDTLRKISSLEKSIVSIFCISLLISFSFTLLYVRKLLIQFDTIKSKIKSSAEATQLQSTKLHESAHLVASGSSQSAQAIEESAAAVEEILSMTKKNNDSSKLAEQLATSSLSISEKGYIQIAALIKNMDSLRESSKKIEGITEVIDDLSFQTNLLALNASVEAARAGEQGKGFAVVADAVRSLANRSSQSAKEINDLILQSTQLVQNGQKDAHNSGSLLKDIVEQNGKLKNLIVEISNASNEQETSLNQVSNSISILDQSAQNNALSSQTVSSSSTQLLDESKELFTQISSFESLVDGKKKAA